MTSTGSASLPIREKEAQFGRELRKQFLFDKKHINLNHGEWNHFWLGSLAMAIHEHGNISATISVAYISLVFIEEALTDVGSFGTYPRVVQTALRAFQDQAEARPDAFIRYEYPKLLDEARNAMSKVTIPDLFALFHIVSLDLRRLGC